MSRSSAFEFRGRGLWAATESLQVWLAMLIESAREVEAHDEPWFEEIIRHWCAQATVADLGCTLDDAWTDEQLAVVIELAKRTRAQLRQPGIESRLLNPAWSVLDDLPVAGGVAIPRVVARIDEVADAFTRLLEGTLPPDPPAAWWGVGWASGAWATIPMRSK